MVNAKEEVGHSLRIASSSIAKQIMACGRKVVEVIIIVVDNDEQITKFELDEVDETSERMKKALAKTKALESAVHEVWCRAASTFLSQPPVIKLMTVKKRPVGHTFPQFQRLSQEVQDMIWEFAMSQHPRAVIFRQQSRESRWCSDSYLKVSNRRQPPLLSVCHASGCIALTRLTRLYETEEAEEEYNDIDEDYFRDYFKDYVGDSLEGYIEDEDEDYVPENDEVHVADNDKADADSDEYNSDDSMDSGKNVFNGYEYHDYRFNDQFLATGPKAGYYHRTIDLFVLPDNYQDPKIVYGLLSLCRYEVKRLGFYSFTRHELSVFVNWFSELKKCVVGRNSSGTQEIIVLFGKPKANFKMTFEPVTQQSEWISDGSKDFYRKASSFISRLQKDFKDSGISIQTANLVPIRRSVNPYSY